MSKTKHTPGPWIYSKNERYFPRVEFPAARLEDRYLTVNEPVGEVMGVYEANARLIAAAPDLLAAGREALALLEGMGAGVNDKGYADLTAAIAAATGATP